MVMRSAPSRSAIARVSPLSASASAGFCSLNTPAPVHGASVSSTSSMPRTSATLCVATYNSGQAPLETQPGQKATFIQRSSFESSAELGEDLLHALEAGNLVMNDRRQLARTQQVDRRRQRLQLCADVEDAHRFRQQRQLVQAATAAHRFCERIRVPRAGVVRITGFYRHATQLKDLLERGDAFGALLYALVAVGAVPHTVGLAVCAEPIFILVVARVGRIAIRFGERGRSQEVLVDRKRFAIHETGTARDAADLLDQVLHRRVGHAVLFAR